MCVWGGDSDVYLCPSIFSASPHPPSILEARAEPRDGAGVAVRVHEIRLAARDQIGRALLSSLPAIFGPGGDTWPRKGLEHVHQLPGYCHLARGY